MAVVDHLVYAGPDLDALVERFVERTGVRPVAGGAHPGKGTRNALVSLGDCYLELIGIDHDQPEPEAPRPFGVGTFDEPCLVTFAARSSGTETLEELVAASRAAGWDPGDPTPLSRETPDGTELHWRNTWPRNDHDGSFPFLIDWGTTPMPSTTAPGGVSLVGLATGTADPVAVRRVYDALDLEVDVRTGTSGLTATLAVRDDTFVL